MPLTQLQKANLIGGIGSDFARALNPHAQPWQDITLGATHAPSAAVVLGQQNVPWPTTKTVQTSPGRASAPNSLTPEFLDVEEPTYEEQPTTTQVPRVWAEAQLKTQKETQDIESQQYDITKKKMENKILADRAEMRGKVSGLLESKSIKAGGIDTTRGFAYGMASTLSLDPDSKPDKMMEWVNDFEKGDSTILSGFANFTTALKQAGYDLNDPDVRKEAVNIGSPTYNAMKEKAYMLSREFKPFENKETGITTFYYTAGDKLVKIPGSEIKTGLTTAEKVKEKTALTKAEEGIKDRYRKPGASIEAYEYYRSQTKAPISYDQFLMKMWRPTIMSLFGSGETGIGEGGERPTGEVKPGGKGGFTWKKGKLVPNK